MSPSRAARRRETRGRIALLRRDQVDQAVREARQRRRIGLGGADVHVAEYLRRIDADDIAGKARRQFEGQRRLAAGRRADQQMTRRAGWGLCGIIGRA
jgi:hypothetical protein